jgi:hypothetical protein
VHWETPTARLLPRLLDVSGAFRRQAARNLYATLDATGLLPGLFDATWRDRYGCARTGE